MRPCQSWLAVTATSILAAAAWAPAGSAQSPKLDLSEKALVARASRYVTEYEKQFAFLIADEEYRQTQFDADNRRLRSRQLRGELFLTYLPVDGEWIAVRDVMEVDGKPAADRTNLQALLSRREELRGLASQIVATNARYNIGTITRNFNEPTLPLLLLEAKRLANVKFDRQLVVREGDTTLVTLAFAERNTPTLVAAPEGPVKAKGEFVIDAATGAIRRTVFVLDRKDVKVRLDTTYARDAKLDLWVPAVFTERYETPGFILTGSEFSRTRERVAPERIECEAKYTNYRRFDVTARIK